MNSLHIIALFHLFPPEHNAGSETTVHAALRAMVNRGHTVKVICDRSTQAPYLIDGISVVRPPRRGVQYWLQQFCKDADLLVTHLDLTSQAMGIANDVNKPLAHFVHNSAQLDYWHVRDKAFGQGDKWGPSCRLVVFNSKWIEEEYEWDGKFVTVHPVVEPENYRCETGSKVTLVNPTSGKGANTFYALAKQMPEVEFLTAQGGYGIQVPCPRGSSIHDFYDEYGSTIPCHGFPNVTHVKNDPDIRNIFRQTKVLLMPSEYESYGRVGIEAACAGIPTIAHPTEGLTEAFGDAGIFIDRNDIAAWYVEVDRLLNDEIYYRKRSSMVLKLAESLTPESEFDRLEKAFQETVEEWMFNQQAIEGKVVISNRRFGKTADNQLTDNMAQAQSLICGSAGQTIPPEWVEEATQKGFVDTPAPAVSAEPFLDTSTLDPGHGTPEQKAIENAPENKAIASPEETKKRTRKKKEAA